MSGPGGPRQSESEASESLSGTTSTSRTPGKSLRFKLLSTGTVSPAAASESESGPAAGGGHGPVPDTVARPAGGSGLVTVALAAALRQAVTGSRAGSSDSPGPGRDFRVDTRDSD